MTDSEFIARLAKENEELKDIVKECLTQFDEITSFIVCIGGPLNDNIKQYNPSQLKDWHDILNIAEGMSSDINYYLHGEQE